MKPLVLVILDGFGAAPPSPGNAIALAQKPHFDEWMQHFPHTTLRASGDDVGLPAGTQGTSEAGHITIGAGRVVYQPSVAVDRAIRDGSFYTNPVLREAMQHAVQSKKTVHIMGLFSDAGVHGDIRHMFALLEMAKQFHVSSVMFHLFLDGRDVPEKSASLYLTQLDEKIREVGLGKIASMIGRYYAMDRDTNWDRTEAAYNLFVRGVGHEVRTPLEGLQQAYARGERSDYYVEATVIVDDQGPVGPIAEGDVVICANFRSDRARQLTYAFVEKHFEPFARSSFPNPYFVGMSTYDQEINMRAAYPQLQVTQNFAQILSGHGLRQLRVAETEKYAHVTYFFNSQVEDPVPGEERVLVHSLKAPSYDACPEMSAYKIRDEVLHALAKQQHDVIVVNFANADLVGHSGVLLAAKRAVEVIDECLGAVWEAVQAHGGTMIITGDHGNAESMITANGEQNPSHTLNPVPLIVLDPKLNKRTLRTDGALQDVAPTLLTLLGLSVPPEMTGQNLFT